MSYGIVRVQKMTAGGVKGIEIHDQRAKESKTNPDIDQSKTEQNYSLIENNLTYQKKIKERISDLTLKKAVRKDAIVMGQVLVTSDSSFFENLTPEKQKEFFKDSFEFLKNRYGAENVVSATVHMDEKTPHMHFNFVPVTADGRLCAKEILTPVTLREQHTQFYEQVGKKYGLERGEQGGNKKHLETPEYKKLMEEFQKLQSEHQEALKTAVELRKGIEVLENSKSVLQGKIEGIEDEYNGKVLTQKGLDSIQPEKGAFGSVKNTSLEEIDNLKKTALQTPKLKIENKNLKEEIRKLHAENTVLQKKIPNLAEKLEQAKNTHRLEVLEKAFAKISKEKQKELLQNEKSNRQRDLGHER